MRKIRALDKILVPADKTRNIYAVEPTDYRKLLTENITQKYKKADPSVITNINNDLHTIAKKLDIEDRGRSNCIPGSSDD